VRISEIAAVILCAASAVIGARCIQAAWEFETFFASPFAVPGIANVASATLGVVLLWRTRNSPGRARLSRWILAIPAAVIVLTSLWVFLLILSIEVTA
jgi:hypothetical protein